MKKVFFYFLIFAVLLSVVAFAEETEETVTDTTEITETLTEETGEGTETAGEKVEEPENLIRVGLFFGNTAVTELKVKTLLSKVARYSGSINLAIVPFTDIQDEIANNCPEEYFTLIMRRMMMRIAQKIAKNSGSLALITGESLGQVASQTLPALVTTDIVTNMPVLRPLIGMDKEEIITISRKIDAFETSILPYEDCCTVFTPKHPKTRPTVELCEKAEEGLDIDRLVEEAIANTEYTFID
jgi:thiamine biosynthesis protein ThiI